MRAHLSTSEAAIKSQTYKDAGVDIRAGNALVDAIRPLAKATARAGADPDLGGFGGLFDPAAAGFRDPILVSGTDGVGTKLLVAIAVGRHDSIGIDLVAMCANDVLAQGAEPLFFLDYFATGRLDPEVAKSVVKGVAEGCRQAGCALIGGETAETPGLYEPGHYDLAGFCVGAVERGRLLPSATVAAGDVVLGLPSSGLHANGFSLVRRIVEAQRLRYGDPAPFAAERSLGDALLEPTRIYVASCREALEAGDEIKALAHITGGGLLENLPRVLPPGLAIELDATTWSLPPVFRWLAEAGPIEPSELARTFNCGIGMAAVVAGAAADAVARRLTGARAIGRVVAAADEAPRTRILNLETAWRS